MEQTQGADRERNHYHYAIELLQSGQTEPAIVELKALLASAPTMPLPVGGLADPLLSVRDYPTLLLLQLGIAHMRLGEVQNCVEHHNQDRCLFPIKGAGTHQNPAGSEAAIGYFEQALARDPQCVEARWLLNIAAMTVQKYPSGIPAQYVYPEQLFRSSRSSPISSMSHAPPA